MVMEKIRAATHAGRISHVVGAIGIMFILVLVLAGVLGQGALFHSTFSDHTTTVNSLLMLLGFTATVLGLGKILGDIRFFQAQDRGNPRNE